MRIFYENRRFLVPYQYNFTLRKIKQLELVAMPNYLQKSYEMWYTKQKR